MNSDEAKHCILEGHFFLEEMDKWIARPMAKKFYEARAAGGDAWAADTTDGKGGRYSRGNNALMDPPLDLKCECGEALPVRSHWTWDCAALNSTRGDLRNPTDDAADYERKLCIKTVPRCAAPDARSNDVHAAMASRMRELAEDGNQPLHVGTDGGSKAKRNDCDASWGVAIARPIPDMLPEIPEASGSEDEDQGTNDYVDLHGRRRPRGLQTTSNNRARQRIRLRREENARRRERRDTQDLDSAIDARYNGWVRGAGQSSYDAELYCLQQVTRAAREAETDLHVAIDNSGVQSKFKGICQQTLHRPPKWCFGTWDDIRADCARRQHSTLWCPSHGKKPNWKPSHDCRTADGYRALNRAADAEATTALETKTALRSACLAHVKEANSWTRKALETLTAGSRRWDEGIVAQLQAHNMDAYSDEDDVICAEEAEDNHDDEHHDDVPSYLGRWAPDDPEGA
jgi:hypothetical protein